MHDVVQDGEFTKERLKKIEKVFVKTNAHRILFPSVPDEKVAIIPNGIDAKMFEEKVEKNPYLILSTSSPDRHLDATLDVFEELIRRQPEKPWKLAWYYGWGIYDSVHKDNKEMMGWKERQVARYEKLREEGRFEGGTMLSHTEIARKYLESGVFLYPTQFYEIHCISALKAQIAGCKTITSDFAALDETVKKGIKIHTEGEKWGKENTFGDSENRDKYVEAIIDGEESGSVPNDVDWNCVSEKWNKILCKEI
jgi:glycosyltransferase involved in cell wall biosynthesis